MALSNSQNYIIRGNVAIPLSITSPSGYGSDQLTLTINLGNHEFKGRIGSEAASNDAGVFYRDLGIWRMIGTATAINAVLATLTYHGSIDAVVHGPSHMPTISASVVLQNSDGSVAEAGVLTLTPDFQARLVQTTPISWTTPVTEQQQYVQYTPDSAYAILTLPTFTQGTVTNYQETWTPAVMGADHIYIRANAHPTAESVVLQANGVDIGETGVSVTTSPGDAGEWMQSLTDSINQASATSGYRARCFQSKTGVKYHYIRLERFNPTTGERVSFGDVAITRNKAAVSVLPKVSTYMYDDPAFGVIADADLERNAGRYSNGSWKVYASRSSLNAFHQCIMFRPTPGITDHGYFDVTVTDGHQGTTTCQVGLYAVPCTVTAPATITVGEHATGVKIPTFAIEAVQFPFGPEYTATVVASHATTLTGAAGSWNAETKTYTVTGTLDEVRQDLKDIAVDVSTPVSGLTSVNLDLTLTLTSQLGSDSDTVRVTIQNENEAPILLNGGLTRSWTEDTVYTFTDISITDTDPEETVTVAAVLSAAAGVLSASGGTWNGGTRTLTLSGSPATVNAALNGMTFTPVLDYDDNFTMVVTVTDAAGASQSATTAMTCTPVHDPLAILVPDAQFNTKTSATKLFATKPHVSSEHPALPFTTLIISIDDDANGVLMAPMPNGVFNGGESVSRADIGIEDARTWLTNLYYQPVELTGPAVYAETTRSYTEDAPAAVGIEITPATYDTTAQEVTISYTTAQESGEETFAITGVDAAGLNTATVTMLVPNAAGVLKRSDGSPVTEIGDSDPTARTYRVQGTVPAVNAILADISFHPVVNYNASWTLNWTVVVDGMLLDEDAEFSGSVAWTGVAVADPQIVTGLTGTHNMTANNAFFIPAINISDEDAAPNAEYTVTCVFSNPAMVKTVSLNGSPITLTGGSFSTTGTMATLNTKFGTNQFVVTPSGVGRLMKSNATEFTTNHTVTWPPLADGGASPPLYIRDGLPLYFEDPSVTPFTITISVSDGMGTVVSGVKTCYSTQAVISMALGWDTPASLIITAPDQGGIYQGALTPAPESQSIHMVWGPVAKINEWLLDDSIEVRIQTATKDWVVIGVRAWQGKTETGGIPAPTGKEITPGWTYVAHDPNT